jgi:hypothetical protein
MNKIYYTIYKITNKIDGKFYIGSHKTKNLDDNYMGSGKYLKFAQNKYGIENFEKEILFIFETPEDMYSKEAELVNEEFIATENTYNLKVGGFGGWDYINGEIESRILKNRNARKLANKTIKEKYGVDNIKQTDYQRNLQSVKTKEYWNSGLMKPPPNFKGKTHSIESKQKMSESAKNKHNGNNNSQYGTMWITNGTENKKIKKDEPIPEGWNKGRKIKH